MAGSSSSMMALSTHKFIMNLRRNKDSIKAFDELLISCDQYNAGKFLSPKFVF